MPRLDIQQYVLDYLDERLDGVEVRVRVPEPMPKRLVVVTRGGGGRQNGLQDRPGVHLLIYGGGEWETSRLATQVAEILDGMNRSERAFLDGIDLVEEESLRSDPDTQTKPDTPRWFGSYTFTTHAY